MDDLTAIQKRWEATTQGEWITTAGIGGSFYELRIVSRQGDYTDPDASLIDLIDLNNTGADATAEDLIFMAEAHQDVPRLIEEIARLRAAVPVEAIQKVLEYARAYIEIVPGSAEADPHIAEVAAMIGARR